MKRLRQGLLIAGILLLTTQSYAQDWFVQLLMPLKSGQTAEQALARMDHVATQAGLTVVQEVQRPNARVYRMGPVQTPTLVVVLILIDRQQVAIQCQDSTQRGNVRTLCTQVQQGYQQRS